MSTVIVPKSLRVALQTNKHLRNGNFYPNASNHRYLMVEANRIAAWRVKQLCSFSCPISAIPSAGSGSGTRTRWRAYVHSSPFAKYVYARFAMAQCTPDVVSDPYGKLLVQTSGGSTVGHALRHYGYTPGFPADLPSAFDYSRILLKSTSSHAVATINGDTDYKLTISDEDGARLIGCDVYEVCKEPTTANGYLDDSVIVADGPILDNQLNSMISILRNAWKRGPAGLFNWASNTDATAPTNNTTTDKNIIDAATTVSAATPGWTLDLAHRSTERRTTVPCVFAAYAARTLNSGTVKLKDSGGNTVASLTISSSTAAWYTTTVNLPASVAKYDVHHVAAASDTCTTWAVSLFQYEA